MRGFIERQGGDKGSERYVAFFSPEATEAAERNAFVAAWLYVNERAQSPLYYCSKHERTIWRKLQQKYPARYLGVRRWRFERAINSFKMPQKL